MNCFRQRLLVGTTCCLKPHKKQKQTRNVSTHPLYTTHVKLIDLIDVILERDLISLSPREREPLLLFFFFFITICYFFSFRSIVFFFLSFLFLLGHLFFFLHPSHFFNAEKLAANQLSATPGILKE